MITIHPSAEVQTERIGDYTRIWQFCVVLKNATIGENCNVCAYCYIENDVLIGNNVTIKNYSGLCDGVTIEDNVQVGPVVSFTNDKYPRAKQAFTLQRTLVKKNASIGAGSIIIGGVTIGENAMIGAHSLVTKDVPDNELWFGSPAKFVRQITKK